MRRRASLLSFAGRTGRAGFWRAVVMVIVGALLLVSATGFLAAEEEQGGFGEIELALLVSLFGGALLAWIGLAALVRRFHDRGRSGWWLAAGAVPVVGPLFLLAELGLFPGTPGYNGYGPPSGDDRPAPAVVPPAAAPPVAAGPQESREAFRAPPGRPRGRPRSISPTTSASLAEHLASRPPVVVRYGHRGDRPPDRRG